MPRSTKAQAAQKRAAALQDVAPLVGEGRMPSLPAGSLPTRPPAIRQAAAKGDVTSTLEAKPVATKEEKRASRLEQQARLDSVKVILKPQLFASQLFDPPVPPKPSYRMKVSTDENVLAMLRKTILSINGEKGANSRKPEKIECLRTDHPCPEPTCARILTTLARGQVIADHCREHLADPDFGINIEKREKKALSTKANRAQREAEAADIEAGGIAWSDKRRLEWRANWKREREQEGGGDAGPSAPAAAPTLPKPNAEASAGLVKKTGKKRGATSKQGVIVSSEDGVVRELRKLIKLVSSTQIVSKSPASTEYLLQHPHCPEPLCSIKLTTLATGKAVQTHCRLDLDNANYGIDKKQQEQQRLDKAAKKAVRDASDRNVAMGRSSFTKSHLELYAETWKKREGRRAGVRALLFFVSIA
ncbi:hypothetical protein JCM10213v2_000718 [Rhodosporidiobolus nylandii]